MSDLLLPYLVFKTNQLVSILFTSATNLSNAFFKKYRYLLHCLACLNQQEHTIIFILIFLHDHQLEVQDLYH